MIAAIASAALIVAGVLAVGQGVLVLCGRREWTWLAGPVGLALLLVSSGIVAGLGGRGAAVALTLGSLAVAGCALAFARGERQGGGRLALAAAALAALFAAIPFIAAGHVGILGVGLVNDDMASHLLLADWIGERFRPEPVLIDQGYPLGPHALVAGVSSLLGASSIDVFAGLTLAIPALTALVAYSALDGLRAGARVGASALVALPYMAAAYLAQEAFKEPLIAVFLLAFALLLPAVRGRRDAIPLGVLGAGAVYVYSFPGLAWLAATLVIWGALQSLKTPVRPGGMRVLAAVGAGLVVVLVLVAPEIDRLGDFVDFRALHPDRANEGGLGNLPGQISPLEAFGVWPTSEFRLSAAASSLPAVIFYAGALLAAGAFCVALPRWIRRHGSAIPAALAAAALLYVAARVFGTVYTSAKALAIAAPLIMLITLGGLWGATSMRRWPALLGIAFALVATCSSLLILRQAPVGPQAHAAELAEIRPVVEGEKLLFLGRDNFILHELRGSKPFTHVRNFYDPYFVEPNFELRDVGSKFDFDAVTAETLARFPYVLTTRAAYASGPPPGYERAIETGSYVLWERRGAVGDRLPGETGPEPGREGGCEGEPGRVAAFAAPPVVAEVSDWSATTIENGGSATTELELDPGDWEISIQYDATRSLSLSASGFEATLPANLDYRGTAPYWAAGTIEAEGPGPVTITASIQPPPPAGRLLGADSVAHLGALAATRRGAAPGHPSCGDYVDWFIR